jgi:hypothetical protein
MNRRLPAAVALGALIALAAPAAAFVIPVIDPAAIAQAVVMTGNQMSQLANEASQITNQVSSLANEAKNLRGLQNLPGMYAQSQTIRQQVLLMSKAAGSKEDVGDAAGEDVIVGADGTIEDVSQVDAQARAAQGAQEQAQANNLYQSAIANELIKANVLAAQQAIQQQARDNALSAAIRTEAGDGTPIGVR